MLRALGLGDLLTAVPALRGLRRSFPDAILTLAAPAWLADAVDRIGAVDRLLPTEGLVPVNWSGPLELAVNLHGRGPRSTELLRALRPGRLITHRTWVADQHEVDRWCRLLEQHGIPADPEDLRLGETGHTGPAVVHPGASQGSKRWPVRRYAEVARALAPDVVVTGDVSEAERVHAVAGGLPTRVGGSLSGLLDLVAGARLVVCGDTGVAHVATAYGTPSVVLFGPVSPAYWGPRSGPHLVLWHGPDPGMSRISVAEVLAAVRSQVRATCAGRPPPHR